MVVVRQKRVAMTPQRVTRPVEFLSLVRSPTPGTIVWLFSRTGRNGRGCTIYPRESVDVVQTWCRCPTATLLARKAWHCLAAHHREGKARLICECYLSLQTSNEPTILSPCGEFSSIHHVMVNDLIKVYIAIYTYK